MGSKVVTIPFMELTYKEIFSMKFLYTVVREWLMLNGYLDQVGEPNLTFVEVMYYERRLDVKEMRIWWRAQKTPGGSRYYRYRLRIDYRVVNMVNIEVVRNGRKMKVQDGEVTIEIHPSLELDYQNQWDKNPLLKWIEEIYRHRILHHRVEEHRRELYKEAYRLHGFIKKYLELKTFAPEIESFHTKFDRL